MNHNRPRRKLTSILRLHYAKLVVRSALFLGATVLYIVNRMKGTGLVFGGLEKMPAILSLIWLLFVIDMLLRFFPHRLESMGCQKQFARNHLQTGATKPGAELQTPLRTFAVAAAWLVLNGVIGALFFAGVIDSGILLLISMAYAVCDMICILFFCPFQTWFMKNRCCTTCRIYNWDFAMMFTPLAFIPGVYTWSLLGFALLLLIRWEVTLRVHPGRFSEKTNCSLSCAHCEEKLCQHKTQLRHFIKKNAARFREMRGDA